MKKRLFFLVILFFLSTFLVFFRQNDIPAGITHDENELARAAFSIENKPYTPFTTVADGHGTPYLYTLLISFHTFGVNKQALRLPNRICGIVTILIFFEILIFLLKKNKNKYLISFLAAFILATSRWYLHFARVAFETPFLLCIEIISFFFILQFVDKKRLFYLIFSAVFAGVAYNSYQPGRIFFFLPLFVLLLNKENLKSYVIFSLIFVLCILPMSSYLLFHPQNDIRINQQFFLKNSDLTLDKKISYFASNVLTTTNMFIFSGDMNGTHNYTGKPAINPIMLGLLLIGLIYSFGWDKNKKNNFIFLFYIFISLFPTILTYPWENPNMLRTYTCLPGLSYFAAQGMIFLHRKFTLVPLILLILLILLSSLYELRTYFVYQPLVFKQSFDQKDYLKIIQKNAKVNK